MMAIGSEEAPGRILVFRIGHLGDTIVALPAFMKIRRAFPNAHIAFLCNASAGEERKVPAVSVLPKAGPFDELVGYNTPAGLSRVTGAIRLIRRLRRSRFNTVFYLMTRNRTREQINRDRKFFRLCGISNVRCQEVLSRNLLTLPASHPLARVEYEGDFLLRSLSEDGVTPTEAERAFPDLALDADEKLSAERWLETAVVDPPDRQRLVGVGPGSKWDSKIWPEERFGDVIAELIRARSIFPIVFGGPEDRAVGERLVKRWGVGAVAAGSLNVREAGAALSRCSLYVGNDTGTMHLAAAAGTPCVAVFAAIDYPGRWEPPGKSHSFFREPVPCEGCHTPDCFNDHICLTSVSSGRVLEACFGIIDAN